MHILGLVLISTAKVLSMLLVFYTYVVFGAVVLSWVNADPYNPIVRAIRQLTEPVFYAARRILPLSLLRMGIDFSPMVVLFSIFMLREVFVVLLFEWGMRLR